MKNGCDGVVRIFF